MRYLLIYLSFFSAAHTCLAQKERIYENQIYKPEIHTVKLYNPGNNTSNKFQPAAIPLQGQPGLQLEFDELKNNVGNYYVKIIHCTYTWSPSSLQNLDFLNEYNEFRIHDYSLSNNPNPPYYTHYRFALPAVKRSGNYIVIVYQDSNPLNLVLSHRFMVYDNQTSLSQDTQNGSGTPGSTHQQLHFVTHYQGLEIQTPSESLHVVVRQNQRWDNAQSDIKPGLIKEEIKQIEYPLLDGTNYFLAGNEFRFFDFRSIRFPGQNTDRIDRSVTPFHLWIQPDKTKNQQAYAQYPDINGNYYIQNQDAPEGDTSSDYANVIFTLISPFIPDSNIYVIGAFNQWRQENKMIYDHSMNLYRYTVLLKQGWYNYRYIVQSDQYPTYYMEGSHFETENIYEIMVYYRPFGTQTDALIGYFTITR